ncbi:MAG: MFS transporter [Mobiluncus porci]|uniref:MFS transporter n=1 Tax=Mobiluncus porci TaxID=2652278 RepID=A0A7K0K3H9_9ACTO|nr:MFS transporter [Mobiluncus porci]MDD7541013.1 MFS transporter [Mobiluncus porci]MDY5748188.1 MFS transporter [Mobiluncus porci]MST49978.1 MFS transporter [Mobiluncus porci]
MAIDAKTPSTEGSFIQKFTWCLWDAGSASVNAVATTFVFTVYLTSQAFGDQTASSQAVSTGMTIAGIIVALTAPITGQRADRRGKGTFWLAIFSAITIVCLAAMFFVAPDPKLLALGVGLLAVMTMFAEFATVNYYAMLPRISNADNIGKISGIGWASGYFGGIILLMFLNFGFISENNWFGVPTENGMGVRTAMLIAALWAFIFFTPVLFAVPGRVVPGSENLPRESIFKSYKKLFADIKWLFYNAPNVLYFLLASAVFRDGLSGVFTFGGIIAAVTFGFSAGEVIMFAVAANVVAGIATALFGILDDKIGPKKVMFISLVALVISCVAIFALHNGGKIIMWTFGLFMTIWVGPAQSASRSFLARRIPEGHEGEIFGLYQTTGRSVTWFAPLMFTLFISLGTALDGRAAEAIGESTQYWGILGIGMVLLLGLLLLIPVKEDHVVLGRQAAPAPPAGS